MTPLSDSPLCSSVSVQVCDPPFLFSTVISHFPATPFTELGCAAAGTSRDCPGGASACGPTRAVQNFICTPRATVKARVVDATSFSCLTSQPKYSFIDGMPAPLTPHPQGHGARSQLTPGITRRPAPLLLMTSGVSAVGCRPLFDVAVRFYMLLTLPRNIFSPGLRTSWMIFNSRFVHAGR